MKLLEKTSLIRTGNVDHADWNYRPLLGYVQRQRYHLCLSLLGERRYRSLLVVGYGSGVFLPELSLHAERLCAVDIHPFSRQVQELLAREGVTAELRKESAERMGFESSSFDAAVAISSLEFVGDMERAAAELHRVLRPEGRLVVVMPEAYPMLDLALRLMTGEDAGRDYGERRERVLPLLSRHFRVERELRFPRLLSGLLPIYRALLLRKESSHVETRPRSRLRQHA